MKRISTILKKLPTVFNMVSPTSGREVPNQLILRFEDGKLFKSYQSNIALITRDGRTILDRRYWDYSVTTGRYRNEFLGETKKETQEKIDAGVYKLADLNE